MGKKVGVCLPRFCPKHMPNSVFTEEQYATVMDAKKTYSERFDAFQFDNREYWLRFLAPREDYKSVINEFEKKRKQKTAVAMVAADESRVTERPVDGGVRPRNLPNPRKYR